jgi:hypothetical protein
MDFLYVKEIILIYFKVFFYIYIFNSIYARPDLIETLSTNINSLISIDINKMANIRTQPLRKSDTVSSNISNNKCPFVEPIEIPYVAHAAYIR